MLTKKNKKVEKKEGNNCQRHETVKNKKKKKKKKKEERKELNARATKLLKTPRETIGALHVGSAPRVPVLVVFLCPSYGFCRQCAR